jgi:TolB protein
VLLGTRVAGGTEDLYQIDTVTGEVGKRLTTGATGPQFPILSPDRGSVVYLQSGDGGSLRTAAVDGTGDRTLFAQNPDGCDTILRPAWNPVDPTELALVCINGDGVRTLKLVSVDGTVRSTLNVPVSTFDDLTFAPDGASLVYWGADGGDGGALYLQPTNGSAAPKQITSPGGANDADATFSPDGKTIVFRRQSASSTQLLTIQPDGTGLTPITDGTSADQDPIFSPDGTQIAFKSNRNNAAGTSENQIWVISTNGTGLRQLGIGSPGTADGAPAWGPR